MEQFRIAIVEDEAPHAELLKQHIESWQRQQGMGDIQVRHFCKASAFLFAWEEERYDMIFLDIQMPGISGMETARKIRETDGSVKLVFTTGLTDYLEEGYEVEAIRYLLKPITREKVWQCLDKLLQGPAASPQHLFQTQEGAVKLSEQEIEYLEARGHYTICHLRPVRRITGQLQEAAEDRREKQQGSPQDMTGEIRLREGFNALCDRLAHRPFVRCHRSYLCNIAHIYRVEREGILLESGGSIPISRRMYEQVVKAFISYFRGEGGE
ncbi:MAG: LytTR family DNA-binding domain-containing protein [Acetatifactor sp.]|nr:LytTR family DNA-binding domain-containing protein [Acetatifactor sp.]